MTSTNAIAFLLLNKFRNGVDLDTMKKEIVELKEELVSRGHDSGFTQDDMDAVLNHGVCLDTKFRHVSTFLEITNHSIFAFKVKVLGPSLIRVEYKNGKKFLSPVTELPNVIELSYYSNCVLPVYALEAVVGKCQM